MSRWGITLPRSADIPGWRVDARGRKPPTVGWKTTPDVATPKAGVYSGRVGVVTNFRNASEAFTDLHMAELQARGIKWIRESIDWDTIEHVQGVYDWTVPDRWFTQAADYGLSVLGILAYSADWSRSGGTIFYPPSSNTDYAAYCTAVVERYGPNGTFWEGKSQVAPLLTVELWNEPWLYVFWRPEVSPSAYAALAVAGATAVRAADPDVTILAVGDLYQTRADGAFATAFQSAVIAAQPTLATLIDGWAIHSYNSNASPTDDSAAMFFRYQRTVIARDQARYLTALNLPVWITEVGWTTTGSSAVSEATQATYTRAALDRALQTWGDQPYRPHIEKVFIYGFIGDFFPADPTNPEPGFGLIRGADDTYKPALDEIEAYS